MIYQGELFMKKYNFYYDESEHSRKINHKTITADNYYDNFISVVVGWHSEDEADLFERYASFEKKYEYRQSKGELKSSAVKQSQLKSGFASLNENNICMLEDFFDLFDDRIYVYYSVISKMEYVIRQLLDDYENSMLMDMDALKYSIVKALIVYRPVDVIKGVYENSEDLIELLRDFFMAQIKRNKRNEALKQIEIGQFEEILILLDDLSEVRTIEWNYDISFVGFKSYLAEKELSVYELTIDAEGESSDTLRAAERVGLSNVREEDSRNSYGLRMADMLAGIISKLLKALCNELRYDSKEEQVRKKLLSKDWFMVNERQLALYKKMNNVAIELNKAWYKAFAGIYSDDLITLISLLEFMDHFESTKDIRKNIDMQGEYYNTYACEALANYFKQMRSKQPVDIISNTSKDYLLNRRGAKVYFDINMQPVLEIKNDFIVCDVLSVGLTNEGFPLVTIMDGNEAKCYRLPDELSEWAFTSVGLANMGEKIFPSKVLFSKNQEEYTADIFDTTIPNEED